DAVAEEGAGGGGADLERLRDLREGPPLIEASDDDVPLPRGERGDRARKLFQHLAQQEGLIPIRRWLARLVRLAGKGGVEADLPVAPLPLAAGVGIDGRGQLADQVGTEGHAALGVVL